MGQQFDPLRNLLNPNEEQKPEGVRAFESYLQGQSLPHFDFEAMALSSQEATTHAILSRQLRRRSRRYFWGAGVAVVLSLAGQTTFIAALAGLVWIWLIPMGLGFFIGGTILAASLVAESRRHRRASDKHLQETFRLLGLSDKLREGGVDESQ